MPHYKVILHALGLNNYNMVTYNIYNLCTVQRERERERERERVCVRACARARVCVCVCQRTIWLFNACKVKNLMATCYGRNGRGFESHKGQEIVCSPKPSRSARGPTQAHSQWVPAFLSELDWLGCPAANTSHLVPRLRMNGAVPLFPLYAFMA